MDNGASSYRRYLDGDESAFDGIMHDYFDRLVFFINRYVHDTSASEDIAIDVFSDLIVHRHRYNFKASFKAYLFMVGRSRALNYIKRRGRIVCVCEEEAERELVCRSEPIDSILADEMRRAVHKAMDELPADMRAAVHLVYFEQLSYEEAARVMKKTKKQVDNLLYRAKGRLRISLGKETGLYEKF